MPIEIAQPMTDNEALVAILEELRTLEANLFGDYVVSGVDKTVATGDAGADRTLTRAADPLSVKTVVVAAGNAFVSIYEDGHLLAVINNQSWESPLRGIGEITATAGASDESVVISITTYSTPEEE